MLRSICSFRWVQLAALILIPACGPIQPPIQDSLTTIALAQQRKAVAILKLGSSDHSCLEIEVKLGVQQGASFKIVKSAITGSGQGHYGAHIVEVALDPGEIHVVEVRCSRTKSILKLGEPGPNGTGMRSLAWFRIEPGEILNVGYLEVLDSRNAKLARLSVGELPLAALDAYKQAKPGLFAQMKTRLMTVSGPGPVNKAQRLEMCRQMQQHLATGKIEKLPASCSGRNEPPASSGAPTAKPRKA